MNERGRQRNGSVEFYRLLEKAADIHDKKSHDYANNQNPFGNYHFAGNISQLFKNGDDAGFLGRIAEKIYRLSNLENSGKSPKNEAVEDTEEDIVVITTLWMASRRERRGKNQVNQQVLTAEEVDISLTQRYDYLLDRFEGLMRFLDNEISSLGNRIIKLERNHEESESKIERTKARTKRKR